MKKFILGLTLLVSTTSFADTMSDEIKALGDQVIQDRKEQIATLGSRGCEAYKLQLEGILMALSADAQSISADAIGTQNPERIDDMAKMYRNRLPTHARELSRRLHELAEAASLCL